MVASAHPEKSHGANKPETFQKREKPVTIENGK